MVLLAMTASMVEGLGQLQGLEKKATQGLRVEEAPEAEDTGKRTDQEQEDGKSTDDQQFKAGTQSTEPPLSNPKVGNPISHGQVIDISCDLKSHGIQPSSLEALLKGSRVYVPFPEPKAEPVSDANIAVAYS